jgi:hypothetical protein
MTHSNITTRRLWRLRLAIGREITSGYGCYSRSIEDDGD